MIEQGAQCDEHGRWTVRDGELVGEGWSEAAAYCDLMDKQRRAWEEDAAKNDPAARI